MDTCLILTELEPAATEAGLTKVKEYLKQFSYTENRYSSEEGVLAYKKMIANAEKNWQQFATTGLTDPLMALRRDPYEWVRFAGEFEIEKKYHGIEFFLYPTSESKVAVSVAFNSSVYDAIYSFERYTAEVLDLPVKQDFVALLLLIIASFSPSAFALKRLADTEDLVLHMNVADVHNWLVAPRAESIRRWEFKLVGIRSEMVDRRQVEKQWPSESLVRSSSGYLIYDGIGPQRNI